MEQITEKEANEMIEKDREKLQKIIDEGGKIIDTIIREKDKVTTTRKIEPVNGKATSSTIVTALEKVNVTHSFIE